MLCLAMLDLWRVSLSPFACWLHPDLAEGVGWMLTAGKEDRGAVHSGQGVERITVSGEAPTNTRSRAFLWHAHF